MRSRVVACAMAAWLSAIAAAGAETRPGWFNLPVQGGAAALAMLGIPAEERALTLPLLARALHDRETRFASPRTIADLVSAMATPVVGADTSRESIEIPAPLDAETWRQLLELPPDGDLFARFVTDRNALLLASALAATDDSLRALVSRDRDLLKFLYREGSGGFVIASRALALVDGQLALPGGPDAPKIWETLTGAAPARVGPFIRALVTRDQGRVAWYFDTIAGLDAERLAAAWPSDRDGRVASARALYEVFRDAEPQWRPLEQPFRRASGDAWSIVSLIDVADSRVIGPMQAAFWRLVFDADGLDAKAAEQTLARDASAISLPALARTIALQTPHDRRHRFEVVRLAQRVFAAATPQELPSVAVALNGYKSFPSLLQALERMRIARAETWSAMVSAARHVAEAADNRTESLIAFQAAIALLERLRQVRVLDADEADGLLRDLSAVVRADRKVIPSLARWFLDRLLPALPPLERPDAWTGSTAYESRLLQALAGRRDRATPSLEWEGLGYTIDLVAAEQARLQAVRLQIPSRGLDDALVSRRPRDLASALTALVYVLSLGHPDGAAALSRDVATRHDFGFDSTSLLQRMMPWAPPEERQDGGPWRVTGSLIGLDAGLSRLALRRVADEQMPQAPVLTLNDFATLTRTIVTMVPAELRDEERDAIAAAIARGRQRVLEAQGSETALRALARQVRMSSATEQALPWMVAHEPRGDAIASCFSLRDLLWLGEPRLPADALDRWGVAGYALDGRPLTVMSPPAPWEDFAGRADAGQITTQVPDIALRLVEETARLRLPAALVPSLLAYAIEDFWHEAQVRFADDWPRMIRQAAAIQSSRIEDYVAALVGDGVLRAQ